MFCENIQHTSIIGLHVTLSLQQPPCDLLLCLNENTPVLESAMKQVKCQIFQKTVIYLQKKIRFISNFTIQISQICHLR